MPVEEAATIYLVIFFNMKTNLQAVVLKILPHCVACFINIV